MVDLADEQSTPHFETDVQRALVGTRHLDTAQRLVNAVVDDLGRRRVEEQRQVNAGDQQHHERVQGDLADQERPVGREDLVDLPSQSGGEVVALIYRVCLSGRDAARVRAHQPSYYMQ